MGVELRGGSADRKLSGPTLANNYMGSWVSALLLSGSWGCLSCKGHAQKKPLVNTTFPHDWCSCMAALLSSTEVEPLRLPIRAAVFYFEHLASWGSQDWGQDSVVTLCKKTKWQSSASQDTLAFICTEAEWWPAPRPSLPHLRLS